LSPTVAPAGNRYTLIQSDPFAAARSARRTAPV